MPETPAGSTGRKTLNLRVAADFSYRLEAIKIVLVPKGGPASGPTARAFVQG